MDQSYPEPFAGGAELQLPTRRPRLSTLITSSANKPVGGYQVLACLPLPTVSIRKSCDGAAGSNCQELWIRCFDGLAGAVG